MAWTSGPGVSNDDFESDDPSDLEPPSSEAGEYTESSERDLPEKSKRVAFRKLWKHTLNRDSFYSLNTTKSTKFLINI